jgi:type IV fimbrial biogenesis protein FimT
VLEPVMTRRGHGFTLLEAVIALAVLAVLGALALPSFGARIERERLAAAAETLASDLANARYEAARRGLTLHLEASAGPGGCWAVVTVPGCACGQPQACQLHRVRPGAYPGVQVVEGHAVRLEPGGTAEAMTVAAFESSRGERLRVDVSTLGRTRICAAAGPSARYPKC